MMIRDVAQALSIDEMGRFATENKSVISCQYRRHPKHQLSYRYHIKNDQLGKLKLESKSNFIRLK
jgi:hypothetical protein